MGRGWKRAGPQPRHRASPLPDITTIATTVGISRRFVYKWLQRYLRAGLAGLADQPGRGVRRKVSPPALTPPHVVSA